MPNNNVINTLSIEFEAEVKKALSSVDELVQRLTHLSHKVGEVRGLKLSLGIGAKTAENLKKFGEALDLLDLDKFKQFAEASQWVSKLNTGLSKDTGDNLLNFAVAIEQIDVSKLYDFGAATSTIQPMSFGVGEKTGQNLLAFADALDHINVDKMVMVSAANANFHALEGIGIGEKTGKNLASFASALNLVDIAKLREFSDIGGSFESISLGIGQATGKNFSAFAHALDELDIEKLRELAAIDFSNIAALGFAGYYIRGLGKELDRLEKVTRKATEAQNRFASSTKKSNSSAKGLLGRIASMAKRVVLLRMIRTALQSVTNGLHEGIENLYYWSQAWGTSFAPEMDRLATAQQYLKNGFASMFSPLIEYAIPIIDRLIDKFVDFFNFVQEGFAQLTGAATWNRARKVPVQYADALDNASKSAKELKHQLLGFDELNVLNTPTDSSRGSNADAKDYSSMFELVETAAGNNLRNIGSRLADAVNEIFADETEWEKKGGQLADFICTGFDNALDFFVEVDWGQVGTSASEFLDEFLEHMGKWIDEHDFGQIIIDLTDNMISFFDGLKVGNILKSIVKFLMRIVLALPGALIGVGAAFHKVLAAVFRWLRWDTFADYFEEQAERTQSLLGRYENWRQNTAIPWVDSLWNDDTDTVNTGAVDSMTKQIDSTLKGAGGSIGSRGAAGTLDLDLGKVKIGYEVEEPGKTKISKWWDNFQKLWDKYTGFGIVKSKIEEIKNKISLWWNDFKQKWGERFALVKSKFEDWKAKIALWWADFKIKWGTRYADVRTRVTNIASAVSAGWSSFSASWGTRWADFKSRVVSIGTAVLNGTSSFASSWGTRWADFKGRVVNISTAASNGWSSFTQSWGTKWADIKSRIINIATAIYNGWKSFTDSWGTNKYADVKSRVVNVATAIYEGWRTLTDTWNRSDRSLSAVISIGLQQVRDSLANAWSTLWNTWYNSDRTLKYNVVASTSGSSGHHGGGSSFANGGFINGYASGGYTTPSIGSLFWAGEGGVPELLGTIGGRSAVAGGAEITGIRDAIYAQAENETALFRQLIAAVNAKDLTLTANSTTGRWVNKALKAYSGVTG